jgi:endonuclease III
MSLSQLVEGLRRFYGPLLQPPAEPFAFRLWQVLNSGATASGRDAAMLALRRLPALTPDALWGTAPGKLEAAAALAGHSGRELRVAGMRDAAALFRRRRTLLEVNRQRFRSALRTLASAGVSQSDAEWLLLFTSEQPILPLDRTICRVASRLGFGALAGPPSLVARSARRGLRRAAGRDVGALREVCFWFSHHGSATCAEEEPRCSVCPMRDACRYESGLEASLQP